MRVLYRINSDVHVDDVISFEGVGVNQAVLCTAGNHPRQILVSGLYESVREYIANNLLTTGYANLEKFTVERVVKDEY